ncbi:nucleotidyltransferase family protein [Maribellus sediminis]|uniref:nucleotidyltransferase family protein n=1 Tax=Maribellus sediminis TaxID=2696285 RepID=UPI00142FD7B6|nr:nucleotidyltransferase family protein [Maribellus sediminis]
MGKIPVILLAAGGSLRMGQAKQLLRWGEVTLIEHQLQILQKLGHPIIVVLGANAEKIIPVIDKYNVTFVINSNWESGMGSSVATGMEKLLADFPSSSAVLFTLVDQPLMSVAHLQKLIDSFSFGTSSIIASRSDEGWEGVPAVFDRNYFDELGKLNGKQGAKSILMKYRDKVQFIEAGRILRDMDSMEAYQKLLAEYLKR